MLIRKLKAQATKSLRGLQEVSFCDKIKFFLYLIENFLIIVITMGKILGLLSLSRQRKQAEWAFKIKSFQFFYSIIIIVKIISTITIAVYSQIRYENVHTKISEQLNNFNWTFWERTFLHFFKLFKISTF